jgi:hypothetical protein
MPSNLRAMITQVRLKMDDLGVRIFSEPEIIADLNEGKNELVKIIRQARENYFETSVARTISTTTSPNYSSIALPADFSEMRDIKVTNAGYEDIGFLKMSQSDERFKQALIDGGNFSAGHGIFFYDFYGESSIIFSPGADLDLGVNLLYIQTIPDMALPTDYPTGIPIEHSDFMVTWAVTESLRKLADERLGSFESKRDFQQEAIINSINSRQIKEPQFVVGFMEEEYW